MKFVFSAGKGGGFIAGYDNMSDEDKQKYNYKRLCKVMGCCMIAVDLRLIISCIIGERATDSTKNTFSIFGILIAILTVILVNTICRKKIPACELKNFEVVEDIYDY